MGRRRLVGVVVALLAAPPEGVETRPLIEVLDPEPVLTAELLDLASFAADYYLAPIGEVVRTMLPPDLEPWGAQRVRLTDRGAMAPAGGDEARVLGALREPGGARSRSCRSARGGGAAALLERLRTQGKVVVEGGERHAGARYRPAVELAAGTIEERRPCRPLAAGARGVTHLAALGRRRRWRSHGGSRQLAGGVARLLSSSACCAASSRYSACRSTATFTQQRAPVP